MTTIFKGTNRIEVQYGVFGPASGRTHRGIDIDTLAGMDWTVHSTVDGTVEFAGMIPKGSDLTWEWGWHVRIKDNKGYRHIFAHCKANSLQVKTGQKVIAGQALATMGKTGNAEYDKQAEHVHYQVDKGTSSSAVNPTPWCGGSNQVGTWPAVGYKEDDMAKFKIYAPTGKVVSSKQVSEGVIAVKGSDNKMYGYVTSGGARMVREYTPATMSKVFEDMTKEMQKNELILSVDD